MLSILCPYQRQRNLKAPPWILDLFAHDIVAQKREDWGVELVSALQEIEFEDEHKTKQVAAQLLDKLPCCRC